MTERILASPEGKQPDVRVVLSAEYIEAQQDNLAETFNPEVNLNADHFNTAPLQSGFELINGQQGVNPTSNMSERAESHRSVNRRDNKRDSHRKDVSQKTKK